MAKEEEPKIMEVEVNNSLLNRKLNVVIEMLDEVIARLRTKKRPGYVG